MANELDAIIIIAWTSICLAAGFFMGFGFYAGKGLFHYFKQRKFKQKESMK